MDKENQDSQDRPRRLDRPINPDRLYQLLLVLCGILLLAGFIDLGHPYFTLDGWFGFYAVFGFAAYSIIVVAGWLWRKLVMRPEDYYDR